MMHYEHGQRPDNNVVGHEGIHCFCLCLSNRVLILEDKARYVKYHERRAGPAQLEVV